jgi:hypothetical protein
MIAVHPRTEVARACALAGAQQLRRADPTAPGKAFLQAISFAAGTIRGDSSGVANTMSTNRAPLQIFKQAKHECEEHLRRIEANPWFRVSTPETGEVYVAPREKDWDRQLIRRRIDRLTAAIDRLKSA